MSREQFAESSGLDLAVVEQLERGEPPGPNLDVLHRVRGVFGLKLWELFEAIEKVEAASLFGDRLAQLRLRRRWSREQLAQASGLDITTIDDIESDKISPNLELLRRLAQALGLKLSELFEDADLMP